MRAEHAIKTCEHGAPLVTSLEASKLAKMTAPVKTSPASILAMVRTAQCYVVNIVVSIKCR